MVSIVGFISQFFAVLGATLIGVFLAFRLDRYQQRRQTQRRAIDHLRSLKSEIESNAERVERNNQLIRHLQQEPREGVHYILESLDTDAWLAALEEPIVGTISTELYEDLQARYSEIKAINSLIDRQKRAMHHPVLGTERKTSHPSYQIWSIPVDFYDNEDEEIDYLDLGILIWRESKSLGDTEDLIEKIEDEMDRLEG